MDQRSFFDSFSPKTAFIGGLVSAILVLCTVGFIILLIVVLGGGKLGGKGLGSTGDGGARVVANTPTAPNLPEETVGDFREIDEKRDHIRGSKNADIALLEYSDLECPFCKKFHETMKNIVVKNEGKVRWVYRHFPLDGLHSKARPEAEASECASEQGKFWEFVDEVFKRTPSNDGLDLTTLPDIAKTAGVKDIDKFNKCVSDKKFASKVEEDSQDAARAGGRGTPYTIIISPKGQKIPVSGALPESSIQSAIDSLLKG